VTNFSLIIVILKIKFVGDVYFPPVPPILDCSIYPIVFSIRFLLVFSFIYKELINYIFPCFLFFHIYYFYLNKYNLFINCMKFLSNIM